MSNLAASLAIALLGAALVINLGMPQSFRLQTTSLYLIWLAFGLLVYAGFRSSRRWGLVAPVTLISLYIWLLAQGH